MIPHREQDSQQPSRPYCPTNIYRQRIELPLEYPVIFEEDCLDPSNEALVWAISHTEPARRHKVAVFCDSGFLHSTKGFRERLEAYFETHRDKLELRLSCVEVPGGELCKNQPELVHSLHRQLDEAHLDRHCVALSFGGGSVLDAVGFVAATFHRGMRMVRVPTTVLAQNDAGVGVKNGVNSLGKKNLLGTFSAPFAVLNDVQFLTTLKERDQRAGLAEAVKVALIRDPSFFSWLVQNAQALSRFRLSAVAHMVQQTARLHLEHIARGGDPFELGNSRPLDFGHWTAHKLEALSDYQLRHGEAVAIGIAIDCLYAAQRGMLPHGEAELILHLLEKLGFRLFDESLEHEEHGRLAVLAGLQEFREHLGGDLTLTMLSGIGSPFEVHEIEEETIHHVIAILKRRSQSAE